jgi:very-short-patch-repair endonuclease/DNA modification methylase
VGTQAQFRKKKPPQRYRYDSSLAPELHWDGQNGAREVGEWLLGVIEILASAPQEQKTENLDVERALHAQHPNFRESFEFRDARGEVLHRIHTLPEALDLLRRISGPFLDWAGKAEHLSFDVPTLPLFVHERLSTKAILETLKGHKRDKQMSFFDLFADPQHSVADQVLRAYEHRDNWTNRLILGDSLVVMNSLLQYESLGGQVQMIYMDPPYGVKFGSNFQPFVRKRDVKHNDDEDLTREPEMVKAYRDTWELGLHSYLTYLRDRLLLARDLLHPSGSIFVQISDENVHHVRELMDEVFGAENFCGLITFRKTAGAGSPSLGTEVIASVSDYLLWYAKDRELVKYRQIYVPKKSAAGDGAYTWYELPDGTRHKMNIADRDDVSQLPEGSRVFRADNLTSQSGVEKTKYPVEFEGQVFRPTKGVWKTSEQGMQMLKEKRRLILIGNTLSYVRFFDDFPVQSINNFWEDTVVAGFADPKAYVVQTNKKVIERCMLMTTDPGDLVFDPTCVRAGTRIWAPLNPPVSGGKQDSPPLTGGQGGAACLRPIETLRPGDLILAHDGQPHRVKRLISKPYRGLMVGIHHDLHPEPLWLTADHLVLCKPRPRTLGGHRDWSAVPPDHVQRSRQLRREATPAERGLWSALRGEQLGVKFRRQHPIGPYIADFYSREAHLVVEADGDSHFTAEGAAHDQQRDAYLRDFGLDILRFTNNEILRNLPGVIQAIQSHIELRTQSIEGAQWIQAGSLLPGDLVYFGEERQVVELRSVETSLSTETVYDLEIEGAHSFLTEVCAVHNCGSGTSAYVAEQWGRRWITADVSRVPLALARQRLLTATYPYHQLMDESRGPAGGFVYKRRQNNKGEEVGGIVPHVTLKSIANNEPPAEEVLVDRPETDGKITRVTGPFVVEATIPTPMDWDPTPAIPVNGEEANLPPFTGGLEGGDDYGTYLERMIEVLRRSPVLLLGGGKSVALKGVRPPAKSLSLSAEAMVESGQTSVPVAIVFGPENGAVSEKLVYEAAREANMKGYNHLYVIGFAIEAKARTLIEACESVAGVPATYVQATPDLLMGDLLKNMRSSQIFSVCGLPEIKVTATSDKEGGEKQYQVELLGLDVFDPVTMENEHRRGDDVPAWLLDCDYNGLVFHVSQAFFPRTAAWDSLQRALKGQYEDAVWDHLAGTVSTPFEAGDHRQVAVKVIDDRGNELLVISPLPSGRGAGGEE